MQLNLDGIGLRAGSQIHLYPMSLAPVEGAMTVLLGATLAGKTSLMRIMAGLDRPTEGRVIADGADVTGVPYSGDARSFSRAVAGSSAPVVVTGGPSRAGDRNRSNSSSLATGSTAVTPRA